VVLNYVDYSFSALGLLSYSDSDICCKERLENYRTLYDSNTAAITIERSLLAVCESRVELGRPTVNIFMTGTTQSTPRMRESVGLVSRM